MKTTPIVVGLVTGFTLIAVYAQTESKPTSDTAGSQTALLWTYGGNYRMTPPPILHSDSIRIKIKEVELVKSSTGGVVTKITYSPWYGKIDSQSDKFRKAHETQTVSFLLDGDHAAKVKEDDILRMCFYPN